MDEFKKNITNITKEDRDKYFQMPQEFDEYIQKKDKNLKHPLSLAFTS